MVLQIRNLLKFRDFDCLFTSASSNVWKHQCRGVTSGGGGGWGGAGGHGPPSSISEPNKVQQFQFEKQGIFAIRSHNFRDILNPIWSCGDDIETTIHYLLCCPDYLEPSKHWRKHPWQKWFPNLRTISIWRFFNNDASNTCILNATIQYILATKRFDIPRT